MLEQAVEDRPPIKSRVVPQFGLSNGRQAAGVNGNTLIECVPVIFDGWKIHHIRFDGAWIRQGTVIFKNAQISGELPKTLHFLGKLPNVNYKLPYIYQSRYQSRFYISDSEVCTSISDHAGYCFSRMD